MQNDIYQSIQELDCGELDAFVRQAALDTARAVIDQSGNGKGKLTIDIGLELAKGSGQLLLSHKASFSRPTTKGKLSEEHRGDTLVYVDQRGYMSILPSDQTNLDFTE